MNRCPKFFWNALREEVQPFQPFARLDEAITELACKKLGIEDYFLGQKNDSSELTQQKLDEGQWVVKGRFEYQHLRIKIPIVHKTDEGLDVFFVFIGNIPKDDENIISKTYIVPNLVGKSLSSAVVELSSLGVYFEVQGEGDRIVQQFPAPNTEIESATTILIKTN